MCGNWIIFGGVRGVGDLTTEESKDRHRVRDSLLYRPVLLDLKPYLCVDTEEDENDNLSGVILDCSS